jgi:hypothetical protein
MISQTWVTLLIGAATVAGAYLAARLQRPKIQAETADLVGDTYRKLIDQLRVDIDTIRIELDYERKRNYQLEAWSKALAAQVIELGGVPVLYSDYRRDGNGV